jgi:hypothetical protein
MALPTIDMLTGPGLDPEEETRRLLADLQTQLGGLDEREAARRLQQVGPNEIRRESGIPLRPADVVRVALNVYPACEGGDGYQIGEAAPACAERQSGPRAADLLVDHVRDRLGGRMTAPAAGRIVRQSP